MCVYVSIYGVLKSSKHKRKALVMNKMKTNVSMFVGSGVHIFMGDIRSVMEMFPSITKTLVMISPVSICCVDSVS